jgi:hypothetical protein
METQPLFVKDTEARCPKCDDLIFKFCIDIYHGDRMLKSQIYNNLGQSQENISKLGCQKCNMELGLRKIKWVPPIKDN